MEVDQDVLRSSFARPSLKSVRMFSFLSLALAVPLATAIAPAAVLRPPRTTGLLAHSIWASVLEYGAGAAAPRCARAPCLLARCDTKLGHGVSLLTSVSQPLHACLSRVSCALGAALRCASVAVTPLHRAHVKRCFLWLLRALTLLCPLVHCLRPCSTGAMAELSYCEPPNATATVVVARAASDSAP